MSRRVLCALAAGVPALAGWIRLESPHFELYTDAGPGRGRSMLERLEVVRHAFASAPGAPVLGPLPARVLLFASPGAFRPLRPSESTVGFFQGGPERNYIVLHWAGEQTERVAAHEYVHLLLNHTTVTLPRWLEEGTAEFYSTLRAEGDSLAVGAPIFTHLQTLRRTSWLDASTLAGVTQDSPFYHQPDKAALFYAQSWALVHMLNLSEGYRGALPRFVELLDRGTPAAFQQAFGKTLEAALQDLERYVAAGRFTVIRIPLEPLGSRQITGPRPVPEDESLLVRAELLLDMGREEEAARLYGRLVAADPDSPGVHTGLGALALRRGDYAAARQHLARALALGEAGARTHFEYAMLLRDSGGSPAEVLAALRKAVALNPLFAEAHFMLGGALLRNGRRNEALAHLQKAASLLPRQSSLWHALALALHEAGRADEARRAAWRALEAAATSAEEEMARAALRKMGESHASPESDRSPMVPPSRQPAKGQTIAGALIQVDCLGHAARLFVRLERRTIALLIGRPSQVRIRNAPTGALDLRCGPQASARAIVEYVPRPDPRYGTDGDVIAIQLQ
jgi:tetratricopeptide (TPR) repeat protein